MEQHGGSRYAGGIKDRGVGIGRQSIVPSVLVDEHVPPLPAGQHDVDVLHPAALEQGLDDGAKGAVIGFGIQLDLAARFVEDIRTAMGQLLDYQQRAKAGTSLLIVIETKPTDEDRALATCNGFGVAYPISDKFEVVWPAT